LSHEATDFDDIEFNFSPDGTPQANDPTSYLTWGPYGATAGGGGEIQHILSDPRSDAFVDACFGSEASSIRALAAAPSDHESQARDIVQQAAANPTRRAAWEAGFKCFGAKSEVQAAYQGFAFESGEWLSPGTHRLYTLVPSGEATQIDYAFFIDLTIHMSITQARIEAARSALEAAQADGDASMSPAQRRRIIGQTLVGALSNQIEDRRGRNVVFYADGITLDALTDAEITAWKRRSGLWASDFGLVDDRFPVL
jgi:hypothetical protein